MGFKVSLPYGKDINNYWKSGEGQGKADGDMEKKGIIPGRKM